MLTSAQQAIQARWDAFLANIRDRAQDILDQAQSGCLALFVQGGHDPYTMGNALPAVRHRLLELGSKVQDTWQEKVGHAMSSAGLRWETGMTEEHRKLGATQRWLEAAYDGFETRIQADAARMLAGLLEKQVPAQLSCTQCGSPIALPRVYFAVNLPCGSCHSVNTFEPGELRILHSFALPALARESAWEERCQQEVLPKPAWVVGSDAYARERAKWVERLASRDTSNDQ